MLIASRTITQTSTITSGSTTTTDATVTATEDTTQTETAVATVTVITTTTSTITTVSRTTSYLPGCLTARDEQKRAAAVPTKKPTCFTKYTEGQALSSACKCLSVPTSSTTRTAVLGIAATTTTSVTVGLSKLYQSESSVTNLQSFDQVPSTISATATVTEANTATATATSFATETSTLSTRTTVTRVQTVLVIC